MHIAGQDYLQTDHVNVGDQFNATAGKYIEKILYSSIFSYCKWFELLWHSYPIR